MKPKYSCIVICLMCLFVTAFGATNSNRRTRKTTHKRHRTPATGTGSSSTAGSLPDLPQKPQPQDSTFDGCQPEGVGGDPDLNKLKNRIDDGNYTAVGFGDVSGLTWPKTIERKKRADWPAADTTTVSKYEGIPISLEGYLSVVKNGQKLQGAREEGKESCNCGIDTSAHHDYHIWLRETQSAPQSTSIVVEATPPVRSKHPDWTLDRLTQIATGKQRVRISGWLLLDPEHPDQVGKTRGTIWEIHPIMKVEVQSGTTWQTLN